MPTAPLPSVLPPSDSTLSASSPSNSTLSGSSPGDTPREVSSPGDSTRDALTAPTLRVRSLGKYRLVASLAQGGMARVLLAFVRPGAEARGANTRRADGRDSLVVLKILRDQQPAEGEDVLQLFAAEARLAARLVHPNVVRTLEAAEIDGRYLLAMEYLEGQTYRVVQTRAASHGGLPLCEHLRILSQLARGLHYAHTLRDEHGAPLAVVHRDVSPQNVFVTYDGEVKLLDFGIAYTRESAHHTRVGLIKGKLDYMAPEQLRSEPLDARADVFALGAMLWEAISGARFGGGRAVTDFDKAQARVSGLETDICLLRPDVPAVLAQLVARSLAVSPADRLADAESFADTLDAYLASVGLTPSADSLAALVQPLFARERDKVRTLVEQHMQLARRDQRALDENTAQLPSFSVSDGYTSDWAVARDLSAYSGLHEISAPRAAADDTTRTQLDVRTRGAAPGVAREQDVTRAPDVEARTTGSTSRPGRISKVGPALLLTVGALSGAVLAWVGPTSGGGAPFHESAKLASREPLMRVTVRDVSSPTRLAPTGATPDLLVEEPAFEPLARLVPEPTERLDPLMSMPPTSLDEAPAIAAGEPQVQPELALAERSLLQPMHESEPARLLQPAQRPALEHMQRPIPTAAPEAEPQLDVAPPALAPQAQPPQHHHGKREGQVARPRPQAVAFRKPSKLPREPARQAGATRAAPATTQFEPGPFRQLLERNPYRR